MKHERDPAAQIASLRGRGAERFDPVRLHFLESLAGRTQVQTGAVKRVLEDKLTHALAAYQERFAQAGQAINDKSNLSVQQQERSLQPTALAELTRDLAQQLPKNAQANAEGSDAGMGSRPELKSIRYFRDTWSKLSVDKQLAQAIEQGPENAGPLNSHQLLLRSLAVMRDISPDYLKRFMSYVDTLLWLDQADGKPAVKSTAGEDGGKKRKTGRARAGAR